MVVVGGLAVIGVLVVAGVVGDGSGCGHLCYLNQCLAALFKMA